MASYYANDVEIWDVQSKSSFKVLDIGKKVCCLTSTNNILAVASLDGNLQLWDVQSWEELNSMEFRGLSPTSLHLTADSKYLTIAGSGERDKCVVLEIK